MKQPTETKYELARNTLIPKAEEYADKIAGNAPNSSEKAYADWIKLWNLTYHSKMDSLWRGKRDYEGTIVKPAQRLSKEVKN